MDPPGGPSFLLEASERLAAARSLAEVIDALRSTARQVIDAEGIAVVLREGDQCFYVAEDAVGPLWSGSRFPAETCVSGWAMTHIESVVIPDVRLDARVPQAAYATTFVRSLMMAPIGRPEPAAALGAYWSTPGDRGPATLGRLEALARLAAIAIENARLNHAIEENARSRALMVEAGRMGIWSFDAVTNELVTSEICRRHLGRDPALPLGYPDLVATVHPEDRDRMQAAVAASVTTGVDYDIEYRVVTAEGEVRWIEVRGRPAILPNGTNTGLTGVSIDITERKRMEDALRSSAATLEHLVEERTGELLRTQEALKQSQKLEAMGQLTGGVAHDFNNLLTPIIGSLDMLHRRQIGGEREQRLVSGALQSADRARTLVQRLLAFARRQPLKPVPVDLPALVLGMAELIGTTLGPPIQLLLDLDPDLPLAIADPHQIEMALLNLAVNARDAMPDGGQLTLSAKAGSEAQRAALGVAPGAYMVLRVTDSGTGMDAETRDRAVEPFFSTKGVGQGTGLGLSMAHGLALQLGGTLTIDSAPGAGTSVALWLPGSAEAEVAKAPDASAAPSVTGVALLVDDEDLVRASTADMLTDLGFEVVEFRSPAEALARFDQLHPVDILVTDHLMPGMTGVDLAREMLKARPGLPVLVTSGYSDAVGLAADLPRLEKPFRQSDLAAALARVMAAPLVEPISFTVDA